MAPCTAWFMSWPARARLMPRPRWRNGKLTAWSTNGLKTALQIAVSAKSEAAKIDLNFAAEPLLKQVFVSGGASEEEADAIVAAVKDWTDADNLNGLMGQKLTTIVPLAEKVLPANDFSSQSRELQNVLGVSPKLYNAGCAL